MSKDYKEIIYLNKTELNSALSQLNQGLLESLVKIKNNSRSTSSEAGKSAKLGGGLGGIFNLNASTSDKDNETLDELFGEEKNIVLNDFKLIALLKDAHPKSLDIAKEGDFVQTSGKFNISDFNFSESVLSGKNNSLNPKIKNFMKDIDAWDKNTETSFKQVNHYMQYANSLAQGNIVLSMNGLISFVNRENFRINSGELQALSYTDRSINILGTVEAIIKKDSRELDEEMGNIFYDDKGSLVNFGKIIPILTEFSFLTTGLIEKGDKFIRPIALYFD